jgi:DNA-directed RNA polymerase subunit H (RpoH/RPB5)
MTEISTISALSDTNNTVSIFKIDKTDEDIRQTVLTNVVKMLIERKLIDKKSAPKLLSNLIDKSNRPQDDIYTIKLDHKIDDLYENTEVMVKISKQKLTAISKQSNINEFLSQYKMRHKILIVEEINSKATQYIKTNYSTTEIFLEYQLMINLIDNEIVPRYQILDRNSDDYKEFCNDYNCKKRDIPKLLITDPMARYYNLKKWDIVRVIRASETSGYSPYYRLVV